MDTRQQENVSVAQIFSARLALLRGSRSKRAFSKEIGVESPQTYQHYENRRVPDPDTLLKIAEKTGKSIDWLLGREPLERPAKPASSDMSVFREPSLEGSATPPPASPLFAAEIAALRQECAALKRGQDDIRELLISLLAEERRRNTPPVAQQNAG